ncbi:MAG: hypothetical protein JW940_29960 [Polyangiaceae bacterium]|nr:hypothetical protein [Polyangiaceae bacterium]
MDAFSRIATATTLAVVGIVFVVATGAGVVRLLPWLSSPDVPLLVALPFARALTAVAVETAVLIGVPVGFVVAAAILADRGELTALCALGARPLRIALGALPTLLVCTVCCSAASALIDPGAGVPGRFARDLVEQGRQSCAGATRPRAALVPMTSFTWLCHPGRAPVLVGPVPKSRGRAWLSARNAVPSDDLRRMDLERLELFVLPDGSKPAFRARASQARFEGLTPWGRPAGISNVSRALVVGLTAAVLALSLATMAFELGLRSRIVAAVAGLVVAALSLTLLHRVEAFASGPAPYWLVPWAGVAPWVGGQLLIRARNVRRKLVTRRLSPLGR